MSGDGPRRGVVATSHPLASQAGAALLRAGGNAIDAAAAVQFALNVVEPLASGIGGGAFSLIRLADGELVVLDSRERAPAAVSADLFLGPDGTPIPRAERSASGRAVAVPGTLAGIVAMLERWGSRSLATTLQPAIELAESALPISSWIVPRLRQHRTKLETDPAAAAIFLPGGRLLAEGDRLAQPDLARAFRTIAERGPDVFYHGEIARSIVAAVQARGGCLNLVDLDAYRLAWRTPLAGTYRGLEVQTMPPPGAGVALLEALALLERFDLKDLGVLTGPRLHLELQAMRLALLDRAAYLADPSYARVPVQALLGDAYLAARRQLLRPDSLGPEPRAGRPTGSRERSSEPPAPEAGQTTHFVVVDHWGNLVCCTGTIEEFFGSGIVVPGYGFLLNNEMTDFEPRPGHPNQIRLGARPASSMVPTLVMREDRPWLALGSPGGQTIVTAVLEVLLRAIDDGLPIQAAVELPRVFPSRYPGLTWEAGLPSGTLDHLQSFGHRPADAPTTIGSVQAVMFGPGGPIGAADSRRDPAVVYVDP